MNRIYLLSLFALMASFCFTSCSDDDENFEKSGDLYGMWEPAYAEGFEKDGKYEDTWSIVLNASNGYDDYSRIKFHEDGSCTSYDYRSGTWKLSEIDSYYVKGNKIYIDDEPSTIVKLTGSEMILEISETETYEGVTYDYYDKVTFRKIN